MKAKLALVQMQMSSAYEENIAKADHYIEKATKEGADLVLLPELFEHRYFCQKEDYGRFELAEDPKSSLTLRHYQKLSKDLNVILPISFFEKGRNCYFNSIALIEDGEVKGIYRKSHIPTGECYEEKFYFTPGDTGFMVFKTRIGGIGIGICWDQWFPETARILALKGAEVLLFPTAIGSEPVLPKDSMSHWQNVMKGHASANVMPVLAANRVGTEEDVGSSMTFFGSSFIADQHGDLLCCFNRSEEGVLLYEFDLGEIARERRDWGVFRDRRIDLYGPLLKTED